MGLGGFTPPSSSPMALVVAMGGSIGGLIGGLIPPSSSPIAKVVNRGSG